MKAKVIEQPCPYCAGLGEKGALGVKCVYCAGTGVTALEETDPQRKSVGRLVAHLSDNLNMPAFPGFGSNKGMSLRDYFAGQVLGPVYLDHCGVTDQEDVLDCESIARDAYAIADAMLKERNEC